MAHIRQQQHAHCTRAAVRVLPPSEGDAGAGDGSTRVQAWRRMCTAPHARMHACAVPGRRILLAHPQVTPLNLARAWLRPPDPRNMQSRYIGDLGAYGLVGILENHTQTMCLFASRLSAGAGTGLGTGAARLPAGPGSRGGSPQPAHAPPAWCVCTPPIAGRPASGDPIGSRGAGHSTRPAASNVTVVDTSADHRTQTANGGVSASVRGDGVQAGLSLAYVLQPPNPTTSCTRTCIGRCKPPKTAAHPTPC